MNFNKLDSQLSNGDDAGDAWKIMQGGFRTDWDVDQNTILTVQGDWYEGAAQQRTGDDTKIYGGNLLGRWTHKLTERNEYSIQMYFDRTHRNIPRTLGEDLDTYDLDAKYRFQFGEAHDIVSGFGVRSDFPK